jgi:putative spermidine/putrescine transport system ATP-binding protein
LQVICGLVEPTSGRLLIDGADQTHTPVHQRRMGVVFQSYALFPHLTVQENVAFPLDVRRIPAADLARRVADTLEMVGLGGLRARFPRELSGGQQQRVALARCFVYEPSLILMDEPLGALDRKLRETMQIEIKRLHRQTGATIIFVTHDQDEALALSDRICLMDRARVEQIGTPQDIYERPTTLFAADFIGISNVLRGKIGASGRTLVTADGEFPVDTGQPGAAAAFVIRPEHMDVQPDSPAEPGGLRGTVIESVYAGAETRLMVALPSGAIVTIRRSPALRPLALGEAVVVGWSAQHARILPV